MSNAHLIDQYRIRLQLAPGMNANEIQAKVSHLLREEVFPALEQLFEEHVGPEVVIRLDRLEVKLDTIPLDRLEAELGPRILAALTPQLQDLRTRVNGHASPVAKAVGTDGVAYSPAGGRWESFVFFLEKGHLPWWESFLPWSDLERAALSSVTTSEAALYRLQELLQKSEIGRAHV